MWVLWFILGAILIVAEIFTTGFVLLWFGIGALVAALAGFIGIDSLVIQFHLCNHLNLAHRCFANDLYQLLFTREDGAIVAQWCGCVAGEDRDCCFVE